MKVHLFFYFLFFVSCSEKYTVTELPICRNMEPVRSVVIKEGCYNDMLCLGDSMLLLKAECDSFYFHLYNVDSLAPRKIFGEKGKLPWEFQFPFPYADNTTRASQNQFIDFFDLNLMSNKTINIDYLLKDSLWSACVKQEYVDEKLIYSNELNKLDSSKLVGRDITDSDGMFFIYDVDNKQKKYIKGYPKFDIEKRFMLSVYSGAICANPSKNKIVFGYRHLNAVSFFDCEGKLQKEYYFSYPKKPELSTQFSGVANDYPVYCVDIYGTPNRLYVYNVGESMNYIMKKEGDISVTIIVFDWDGNLIDRYQFSDELSAFCVNQSDTKLYGIQKTGSEQDFTVKLIEVDL